MLRFNKQTTDDFHLVLQPEISFISAKRNEEAKKIEGVDGELFIGDATFSNAEQTYTFFYNGNNLEKDAPVISAWLNEDNQWHELEFSGQPDRVFLAKYTEQLTVQRTLKYYGKVLLTFTVKPYAFLKTGLQPTIIGSSITNPTNRNARPRLKITGTGNITVQIGSERLTLQNVDGGIIVDSLYTTVTNLSETKPLWNKVTSYPLPVIRPGRQSIYTTGNVTKIEIIPRWEVLV